MEKIQVELNTVDHLDVEDAEHEPCESHGDMFFFYYLKELQKTSRILFSHFFLLEPLFIFYYYFKIYRYPKRIINYFYSLSSVF